MALLTESEAVTFEALYSRALEYASYLRANGIRAGARCIFWSENSVELAAAILGCWAHDCVPALVSPGASAEFLDHCCNLVEGSALYTDQSGALEFTSREALYVIKPTDVKAIQPAGVPLSRSGTSEVASIIFTSGSTGQPKGVCQSHWNLIACSTNLHTFFKISSKDKLLCPVSWAFDYGWGQFHQCVFNGLPLVLPRRGSIPSILELLEQHCPTIVAGVPSIYNMINSVAYTLSENKKFVRLLTSSGSFVAKETVRKISETFPGADLSLNYGLTETYRSTSLPPHLVQSLPGSVGFAVPGVKIDVVNEDGEPVPRGVVGEVVHSGLGVFSSYWNAEVLTRSKKRTLAGSSTPSVFTGDLGWIGNLGELYLSGRKDRMVKSADVVVQPEAIENAVMATGMATATAVVSRPDALMGERVEIAIVLNHGCSINDVRKIITKQFGRLGSPRVWHAIPQMPLLPNMKIDYSSVKELLQMAPGSR